MDGCAESQNDLIEGVAGVSIGGGKGIESGVRGERGHEGDQGGNFLWRSVRVVDA
jgi:hypothetical protein